MLCAGKQALECALCGDADRGKAGTPDIDFEYADTHRSLFGL
jgi:hypothetical protein